ncbi:hypothetical protein AMECASPLE_025429, partial [Ameca splendens]
NKPLRPTLLVEAVRDCLLDNCQVSCVPYHLTSKNKARSVRSYLAAMEPHGTLPFTSNQPSHCEIQLILQGTATAPHLHLETVCTHTYVALQMHKTQGPLISPIT